MTQMKLRIILSGFQGINSLVRFSWNHSQQIKRNVAILDTFPGALAGCDIERTRRGKLPLTGVKNQAYFIDLFKQRTDVIKKHT